MTAAAVAPAGQTFGETFRLLVFGRGLPAAFFGWLAYLQLQSLVDDIRILPRPVTPFAVVDGPLPAFLYLLFCVIPVAIYVGRPPPQRRDGRLAPRTLALVATVFVLIIGALPPGPALYTPPPWIRGLSTLLSIGAFTTIISALLYLRRSLSIIPEARRLVVGGPYRMVRHPLYAAEILATLAFAMASGTVLVVAIQLPFIAMQLLRSRYEERLLMEVFPQYAAYASATPRIVPFL